MFMSGLGALADECTVTVQPGEPIQEAIDAAPEGALICLPAGEWQENVEISRSLVLRGEDADSVLLRSADPDTPRISILAPEGDVRVEIRDLTIAGAEGDRGVGVWAQDSVEVVIASCVIAGNRAAGIWLAGSTQATISHCTIRGQDWYGGIRLSDSSQATIVESVITHNALGITLAGSSRAKVRDSDISHNRWVGLSIRAAASLSIMDCDVVGNGAFGGLFVEDSGSLLVKGCTVESNNGPGIQLADSAQATITENTILSNGRCGVALRPELMSGMDKAFTGYVIGKRNTGKGNADDDCCPDDLAFLFTKEGGELDQRE